jgi:hypothetical protein
MSIQTILFQAHSGVRWLVVLATVVAIIAILIGLFQNRPYDGFAKRFMTIFVRSVEIQWLLGLIVLLVMGGVPTGLEYRWGHVALMTVAVVVAHLDMPFRRRPDNVRYMVSLAVIIVTLVIVFAGVAALPGRSLFSM